MMGALLLLTLTLPAPARFCWDPVPGAAHYRLYSATPAPPGALWRCRGQVPAVVACQQPGVCCATADDLPGDLVFYIVTAVAADGTESDGGHGEKGL